MKELLIRMYAVCVCPSNSYAHSVYYILTIAVCISCHVLTVSVCLLFMSVCLLFISVCLLFMCVCVHCLFILSIYACHVGYLRVHLHDLCACLFSGYNFDLNFFLSRVVVYSPCVSCFVYYTVYDWLDGCTRKHS